MTKWSNRLHELNIPRSDIGEKVVIKTHSLTLFVNTDSVVLRLNHVFLLVIAQAT